MDNESNNVNLQELRGTLSFLLGYVILKLFPSVQLSDNGITEDGFFYEFLFYDDQQLDTSLIDQINYELKNLVSNNNNSIKVEKVDTDKAIQYFETTSQTFKIEKLYKLEDKKVNIANLNNHKDIVQDPILKDSININPDCFQVISYSNVSKSIQEPTTTLFRVFGFAFESTDKLNEYILKINEINKRDHKKIGKDLDLFFFDEQIGSDLPVFTTKGTFLKNKLQSIVSNLYDKSRFDEVNTPGLGRINLYETSGHLDKFNQYLFLSQSRQEENAYILKPTNYTHHFTLFSYKTRSYKELPIRLYEINSIYRDLGEDKTAGLFRVKSITQDLATVFCSTEQINNEIVRILKIIKDFSNFIELDFKIRLSIRNPQLNGDYIGAPEDWDYSEKILENILKDNGYEYFIDNTTATFYGPSIDFVCKNIKGEEYPVSTIQLNLSTPKSFNVKYINDKGMEIIPAVIHFSILGSVEKFLALLIEQTMGNFPLWLCYTQTIILPVSFAKHISYAREISKKLRSKKVRVSVDDGDETISNRIRRAQISKIPYMLIVGDKEMDTNTVSVRLKNGANIGIMRIEELVERIQKESQEYKNLNQMIYSL